MLTKELADALRHLIPHFALVEGIYMRVDHPDDLDSIRASIRRGKAQHKRSLRDFEYDLNRRFIVAGFLDHVVEERRGWNPRDLLVIAEIYAALVRDGLRSTFPDQQFTVEIIGRDHIDGEPLELCVTFYHSSTD